MHNFRRGFGTGLLVWTLFIGWAAAETNSTITPPRVPMAESVPHRLLNQIEHDIANVRPWLNRYGYGAVFITIGVEGFGVPAPGQTLLMAGAATAATKTDFSIGWLLLAAFLAAILGSSLGYWMGRRGGWALLRRFRIDESRLQRIEQYFSRYGGGLIVASRFFDGLRQLNSIAAGILKMPWWTFTAYNVLGAALWVGCWGWGIYILDEYWYAILSVIRQINPWVATLTLLGTALLLAYAGYRWHRQNRTRLAHPKRSSTDSV